MKIPSCSLPFDPPSLIYSQTKNILVPSLHGLAIAKNCKCNAPTFTPGVGTMYLYFPTFPPLHGEVFFFPRYARGPPPRGSRWHVHNYNVVWLFFKDFNPFFVIRFITGNWIFRVGENVVEINLLLLIHQLITDWIANFEFVNLMSVKIIIALSSSHTCYFIWNFKTTLK